MSAFLALVAAAPPDPQFEARTRQTLARFAGDSDGEARHGHAAMFWSALRTSPADAAPQPVRRGPLLVVADARLDGTRDLAASIGLDPSAGPAEIIAAAYERYGVECLERWEGDFAFCLWDSARHELFAARDAMGIKPLYYARTGDVTLVSNVLEAVRAHPAVSDDLNEPAIFDFLLFGHNEDRGTTSFRDIHRVPPGHSIHGDGGDLVVRRYWQLSIEPELRHRKPATYVEEFAALFGEAVRERLPEANVGTFLSGGLDSTSVAMTAQARLQHAGRSGALRAFSAVYRELIPDQEREYAEAFALSQGIPLELVESDMLPLFGDPAAREYRRPEPHDLVNVPVTARLLKAAEAHGRVLFDGNGGDPLLAPSAAYVLRNLWRPRVFGKLAEFALREGRFPRIGIRSRLGLRRAPEGPLPDWLPQEQVARYGLPERWRVYLGQYESLHPRRPEAYRVLHSGYWQSLFENYTPAATGTRVEVRYPFFALPVMRFLLRLPTLPWCVDKRLLREYQRGIVPDKVRTRPKTPLVADPVSAYVRRNGLGIEGWFDRPAELDGFVSSDWDPQRFRNDSHADTLWWHLRPLSLAIWLSGVRQGRFR